MSDERAALDVMRAAARAVMLAREPLVVDAKRVQATTLMLVERKAAHVHTVEGVCLRNIFGPRCADEFDWWRALRQ